MGCLLPDLPSSQPPPPLTHSIACAAQCLGCCLPCCWPASGAGGWMVAHYLNHNACLSLLPLGCWSASGVDGWVAARHLGHCAGPSLLPLGCWQLWSCPWCVKLPPSAVAPVPIVPAVVVAVQWPGGAEGLNAHSATSHAELPFPCTDPQASPV